MPISTIIGKSAVALVLMRLRAEAPLPFVLDIGPGIGSYRRLLGPLFPDVRWIAVEVWGPYVSAYNLEELYDQVYISDVTCFDFSLLPRGGIAILGDVLEHIERDKAIATVSKIMNHVDYAVLSVPAGPWPQGEVNGNSHEAHVHTWTADELRDAFKPWLGSFFNQIINSRQSLVSMFLAGSAERRARLATHVAEVGAVLRDKHALNLCGLPMFPDLLDAEFVDRFKSAIERDAGFPRAGD